MHFFNKCPSCNHKRLTPTRHNNIEIDFCKSCGGLWFDKGELSSIASSDEEDYTGYKNSSDHVAQKMGASDSDCPRCNTKMNWHQYSENFDIYVDVCAKCQGIWVKKEQLSLVLATEKADKALYEIDGEITIATRIFQMLTSLPVEYNIKPRITPWVTMILIAINIIVFSLQLTVFRDSNLNRLYSLNPAEFGSIKWFINLFSYQFLHAGFSHIIGNLYLLWVMGDNLEEAIGHKLFFVFYIFCGIAAGIVQSGVNYPNVRHIIGASGAIAGVMAGYIVLFRKAQLTFNVSVFQWKIPSFWYIGVWIILNIINAFVSSSPVAWFAHIGGFTIGFTIIYFYYSKIIDKNPVIKLLNHHQYGDF